MKIFTYKMWFNRQNVIIIFLLIAISCIFYLFQEQKYNKITMNSLQEEINLLKPDITNDNDSQKNYLTDVDIDKYGAEVLQIGGIGSHIIQKTARLLSEHGYLKPADDWVSAGFNSSGDVMDVNCRDEYLIISCKVNNRDYDFFKDDISGCRALIADKMQNRVNIECIKK